MNYTAPSQCALLDGVTELEKFFSTYKEGVLENLCSFAPKYSMIHRHDLRQSSSSSSQHQHLNQDDQQQQQHHSPTSEAFARGPLLRASDLPAIEQQQQSPLNSKKDAQLVLGEAHGVFDVLLHLFSRHGTSHSLLDAIEHLDLLIPNWHEPRKKDDGSLVETPEMRLFAMRTTAQHQQQQSPSGAAAASSSSPPSKSSQQRFLWRNNYTIADVCDFASLKNDPAVVRLLERDRGMGQQQWNIQTQVGQDAAPIRNQDEFRRRFQGIATSSGLGGVSKQPYGWRSRLKFATALRAIEGRPFVSPEAREAIERLEQAVLPKCSFEPRDLVNMSDALSKKLELEADKATREEMIEDIQKQIVAMESFVRALESDQQKMSEHGEMAQLKGAALQQLEWYERLLRAVENQFDVACDDIKSVEAARKARNWDIFRRAKGDLPCVRQRVTARIGRLQSAASRVRDLLHEKATVYENDLKQLDEDLVESADHCKSHLSGLTSAWGELVEAMKKAAEAEKKFTDLGASMRSTVEDRLNLLGARAMKDRSHASLLASANDVLIDFAQEVERLQTSDDFLSELHTIVCSGSENITEQYDYRREELLAQAETIREQHTKWIQEYSVALGRHRHRVTSALSNAETSERNAEMHRELATDLLDVHTRAHAIARDEASTNKVRLRSELAALDGTFHTRNDAYRHRGVSLNLTRQFVSDLIRQTAESRVEKGGILDPERLVEDSKQKRASAVSEIPDENNNRNQFDDSQQQKYQKKHQNPAADPIDSPLFDTTNVDLVNMTALRHLEKEVRNKYELKGHSKQEQAMREVKWERDSIQQAKDATRFVRRVPLVGSSSGPPPAFLSPAPPRCASAGVSRPSHHQQQQQQQRGVGVLTTTAPASKEQLATIEKEQQQNNNNNNPTTSSTILPTLDQYEREKLPQKTSPTSSTGKPPRAVSPVQQQQSQSSTSSTLQQQRPGTAPQQRSRLGNKVSVGEQLRVVFNFEPRVDDELRLQRGDTVIVLRHSSDDPGWAFGVSGDRLGQFPLNYCEPIPHWEK